MRTYVRFRDGVEAARRARGGTGRPAARRARCRGRPPWSVSASRAYCEHDGWNRHAAGRWTLTSRQARIGQHQEPGEERGPTAGRARRGAARSRPRSSAPRPPGSRPARARSAKASVSTGAVRVEEVGAAGDEVVAAARATAARSRRRIRLRSTAEPTRRPMAYATRGGIVGSVGERSAETPGRPGGGEPERGPRRSHGRGRARSGREPLPAAGAAGPEHGSPAAWSASGCGNRGSSRACGCWAGRCASSDGLLEAVARVDSEQGSAAGGGAPECTGGRGPDAQRDCASRELEPLVATRTAGATFPRLAGLRPARRELPR